MAKIGTQGQSLQRRIPSSPVQATEPTFTDESFCVITSPSSPPIILSRFLPTDPTDPRGRSLPFCVFGWRHHRRIHLPKDCLASGPLFVTTWIDERPAGDAYWGRFESGDWYLTGDFDHLQEMSSLATLRSALQCWRGARCRTRRNDVRKGVTSSVAGGCSDRD